MLDLSVTGISHDHNTSCPECINALAKNAMLWRFCVRCALTLTSSRARLQIPSLLLRVKSQQGEYLYGTLPVVNGRSEGI